MRTNILTYKPKGSDVSNQIVRELQTLHGIDLHVFDPDYALERLDPTRLDLKEAVSQLKNEAAPLTVRHTEELFEVFGEVLGTDRHVLIVNGFVYDPETLKQWEERLGANSTFAIYDLLDHGFSPELHGAPNGPVDTYMKGTSSDENRRRISLSALLKDLLRILEEQGVKPLSSAAAA